ncbi:hypothetical protein PBRA_007000 [Plasmodiophora brassicae]|uniref:Uncharacterized protein n=1 Tax=Plasmodiophora brassicae TaxID=37360 RepID=A0A0G4IUV7_PLABS|nr:hypothetical protein PBRA_007000 [Plasmodiophora brassicae]
MNKAGRGDKGSPWIDRVGCGSQSDIPLYGRSYAQSSSQGGQQDTGFSPKTYSQDSSAMLTAQSVTSKTQPYMTTTNKALPGSFLTTIGRYMDAPKAFASALSRTNSNRTPDGPQTEPSLMVQTMTTLSEVKSRLNEIATSVHVAVEEIRNQTSTMPARSSEEFEKRIMSAIDDSNLRTQNALQGFVSDAVRQVDHMISTFQSEILDTIESRSSSAHPSPSTQDACVQTDSPRSRKRRSLSCLDLLQDGSIFNSDSSTSPRRSLPPSIARCDQQ